MTKECLHPLSCTHKNKSNLRQSKLLYFGVSCNFLLSFLYIKWELIKKLSHVSHFSPTGSYSKTVINTHSSFCPFPFCPTFVSSHCPRLLRLDRWETYITVPRLIPFRFLDTADLDMPVSVTISLCDLPCLNKSTQSSFLLSFPNFSHFMSASWYVQTIG